MKKYMQDTRDLREKKGTHEITWKLSTHVSRFDYFLVQLFYTLSHEKREICLVKQHKKYEIIHTHVSCLACFSHLPNCLQPTLEWKLNVRKHNQISKASYRWFAKCEKHTRHDPGVRVISYFLCRFIRPTSCVPHLTVEAVITHERNRFSRAIRDKIIVRENNHIGKRV